MQQLKEKLDYVFKHTHGGASAVILIRTILGVKGVEALKMPDKINLKTSDKIIDELIDYITNDLTQEDIEELNYAIMTVKFANEMFNL